MGRLIDADALKQDLRKCQINSLMAHNEEKNVFDVINEQPTAYDVEKVVAELKDSCNLYPAKYYEENIVIKAVPIDTAIDIVKKGCL